MLGCSTFADDHLEGSHGLDESVDKSIEGDEVWLQMHLPDHLEGSLGQSALSKALMRALEVTACGCRSCCCISLITLKASLGNLALSKALRRVLEVKVWLQISLQDLPAHLKSFLGQLGLDESVDKSIGGDEVWLQMHFPDHLEGSLGQSP